MLLDPLSLSRSYLNRKAVETVVRSHVKGERNYTTVIHKLLSLELIHRLFVGSSRYNDPARVDLSQSDYAVNK